jgi:tripartite-type tricarboxylate transporter receptor subunit TctC
MRGRYLRPILPGTALLLGLGLCAARAETFPSHTITFVDPFTPGGNIDVTARIVAAEFEKVTGQTVIVLNKPGANGILGAEFVKRSKPDGYTLLVGSNGPLSSAPIFRKPNYDVQKDFTAIGLMSWTPECLVVGPDFPVKTGAELLAYGKTKQIRTASGGIDSAPGITMAEFNLQAKLNLVQPVYQGASEFYPALMGGHVDMAFDAISTAAPMTKSGAVRMLAVADDVRSPMAPDVPTLKESGLDVVGGAYAGLVVPSGTPQNVVVALRAAFSKTMVDRDVKQHLEQLGSVVRDSSAASLDAIIRGETEKARTVKAAQASSSTTQ